MHKLCTLQLCEVSGKVLLHAEYVEFFFFFLLNFSFVSMLRRKKYSLPLAKSSQMNVN